MVILITESKIFNNTRSIKFLDQFSEFNTFNRFFKQSRYHKISNNFYLALENAIINCSTNELVAHAVPSIPWCKYEIVKNKFNISEAAFKRGKKRDIEYFKSENTDYSLIYLDTSAISTQKDIIESIIFNGENADFNFNFELIWTTKK